MSNTDNRKWVTETEELIPSDFDGLTPQEFADKILQEAKDTARFVGETRNMRVKIEEYYSGMVFELEYERPENEAERKERERIEEGWRARAAEKEAQERAELARLKAKYEGG